MTASQEKWLRPSVLLGLATLVIHLILNGGYGIFRDELYFIVCGRHPAWGYVDQPPVVPLLAAWSYALSGDWLIGFRLIPAVTFAVTVGLTAEFARVIGGGKFAQGLAGLCALGAPHFLAIGLIFTTDTFQPLSVLLCAWLLVRIEQTRNEKLWLALGAVVGLSLLTKYMIAFYAVAIALGLLATPLRQSYLRPWIWAGAALAILIPLPNILWQQTHGWPFRELGEAASHGKNIALSPLAFFGQQLLEAGPLAAPVWLAGLWASARRPNALRAFPIAYVLLFAFFIATHGKAYYLTNIYPVLWAAGGVAIERWVVRGWARGLMAAAVAVASALIAPLAIPVMSEEAFIRYSAALGVNPQATAAENLHQSSLPQHFADQHGWPEMAAKIAKVYWSLPPADRAKAVFYGNNYGEAAAIDVYGTRLGLPPAIAGHNNYYLWGPRGHDGSVVIIIGGSPEHYASLFRSTSVAGRIDTRYAMPYETDKPIYVLRGMKMPLKTYWPNTKNYQ